MGRTRRGPSPAQDPKQLGLLAPLALLLMGETKPPPGSTVQAAVATLLSLLAAGALPGTLVGLDSRLTPAVASLVLEDLPGKPKGSGAILAAKRGEFSYRAAYALNALSRVGTALASGEDLQDALTAEGRYLGQHLAASRQRRAGVRMVEAAADRYGPILGWQHVDRGQSHRPEHLAASGQNFDVRRPPAATYRMFPGQAMHCHCVAVKPFVGAATLV